MTCPLALDPVLNWLTFDIDISDIYLHNTATSPDDTGMLIIYEHEFIGARGVN